MTAGNGQAPTVNFTDERLGNGLRLIMSPDPLAPVAAVNLWYNVGSRHEVPGQTGLAHLFEHMMFQGSRNVGKAEHFRLVSGAGGTLNGTTWVDRTNYFETVPSHHLELILWLEADRMGGLLDALGQETLDNQRDVVKNEKRQSYDNRPYGSSSEKLQAAVFPKGHPYHHSTIGSMEDLDAASLEDVRAFFRTYYAPNNAVLSIVGDFEPDVARGWVEKHFGSIPANPNIPAPPDGSLPPLMGAEVRQTVPDRVPMSRLYIGYRSPPLGTPEFDALSMATVVLAQGKGSRLYGDLVRGKELAQDVGIGAGLLQGLQHFHRAADRDFLDPLGAGRHGGDEGHVRAPRRRHLGERAAHLAAGEIADIAHGIDGFPGAARADDDAETVEGPAAREHRFDDGDDPPGGGQAAHARLARGQAPARRFHDDRAPRP